MFSNNSVVPPTLSGTALGKKDGSATENILFNPGKEGPEVDEGLISRPSNGDD
jgi:hypothetical protein